jgi:N-dimethylarginine dimethylaminohydrolase
MSERFLMCAPDHFEVAYVINPWMEGNISHGNNDVARQQWNDLADKISAVARVERITAAAGVPDMVFTANAGLVLDNKFVLSRFRHVQRQGEEAHFARWFGAQGFEVLVLPPEVLFEGAGDALFDRRLPVLWMGYGHRSDQACRPILENWLGLEVLTLRLVNPRFYHLDTCFCPLQGGYLLYYPPAFDEASQALIAARVPEELRIAVSDSDAADFACNAVNSGSEVFLNRASDALVHTLAARGLRVQQSPLSEFMKAGGAAKCLTIKLTESSLQA